MNSSKPFSGDVISGALLAALGAYIAVTSDQWTILGHDGPGPGFFPLCYGVILLIGSLALVLMGLFKRPAPREEPVDWAGIRKALGVWAVFALMVPMMKYLGFLIALGILIFFFLRAIYPWRLVPSVIASVLTPAGFFVIFPTLLNVELPVGAWTGF
jgi:putative tricarboxylic transport membrane protein